MYAVYKCALESEYITTILVIFYNILIRECYYPKQWLKLLDATLEKGKGPILEKIRIITLIEEDL